MNRINKNKLNLLIFIYSLGDGGAERVSANLANYWAAKGWEITIVTLAPKNLDLFELHPDVIRVSLGMARDSSNIINGLWQNIRRIIALRRVLRKFRPDIALSQMTTANILLALAAYGLPNLQTIGAEHTYPGRGCLRKMWKTLRANTYGLLSAVSVLTSEGKNWIKNYTNAKRVMIIPNAVVLPLPDGKPRIVPNSSYQAERRLLLSVGRLIEVKAFDKLIEAFSNLSEKYSNWDLIILGEGYLRPSLEKQIKQLELHNRIMLPGWAGNIKEWYENADLFVMSSRNEGFPMTLVEVMAHGVAVVSFDCETGPRDIIRNEVDGLLVKPQSVTELTYSLDRLMGDDELREQYSKNALEVHERFSMSRIVGIWENLFMDLLNENVIPN